MHPCLQTLLGLVFALLTCVQASLRSAELRFPTIPPTPPESAEKTFETLHGFRMQLIAAEPLVTDPVAITYDEDGRAYVCEMSDYPYTDKAAHKPSQENPTDQSIGKVRLLTDTDDDGVFDKATIFAADLSWPTGAACWKGGIIVVATPDIWYLKDTDGDGVADVRQKLFTGLKKLNVQAVANNPVWGLDNKLYIAGGSNGGEIRSLVHPEEPRLTLRRADLRLDPATMKLELTSGGARFGNTRDDWGNRFLCNIRNPAQHVVIDLRYLARNPYLPPVNPLHDAAESGDQLPVHRISPPEAWRELRAQRWSADGVHMPHSELVGSGVVTSSSGITCYRGDAYPASYRGNLFVADVAANLFYRLIPEPDGVTFKANRSPDDGEKEFCASRDIWHRPVNFANAPDGTLTVCDMYREAIEHPWSLPDDIHAALDLERGRDKGRLYRLAPPTFTRRKTPQLSKATTEELVKLLEHPNAWHRDTAHRLLFERQDKSAVPMLREMVEKNASALARVEALWVLAGMGELTERTVIASLEDADPNVRRQSVVLAEPLLKDMLHRPQDVIRKAYVGDRQTYLALSRMLFAAMQQKATDSAIQVRFQAMLDVGDVCGGLGIAWHPLPSDVQNSWMQTALLAADMSFVSQCIPLALQNPESAATAQFAMNAARMLGSLQNEYECRAVLCELKDCQTSHPQTAESGLLGLCEGTQRSGTSPMLLLSSSKLVAMKRVGELQDWLRATAARQREKALTVTLPVEDRTRAIGLLALEDFPALQPLAAKLLQASEPDAVRLAVIQMLRQKRDNDIAQLFLDAWPTLTPDPREAAAQALASRPAWTEALLTAIEKQQVKPAEVSPTIRASLQRLTNAALRDRASKLFAASGTRAEVLAKYQPALSLKGDAAAGHTVFLTACATCHRKGTEGRDLGPNLATVLSWSPEQLLTNILDPNREVSPNFLLYAVQMNDGRFLSGLITSETSTSLALKGADLIEQSVPRSEVKSLKSTGLSLMPEGLEAAITPQQMADVMAFLRGR